MGKKSKAKKIQKTPENGEIIREEKTGVSRIEKIKKIAGTDTKRLGAALLATGILLLTLAFVFTYLKSTLESFSRILPKESTIGFVEINIGNKTELQNAQNILGKYEIYKPENITKSLRDILGIDFANAGFVGGKIGIAFLKSDQNQAEVVVFIGTKDKGEALRFLDGLALKQKGDEFLCGKIENSEICHYTLSYNLNFAFIGDYLAISPLQTTLLRLAKTENYVSGDKKFIHIRNNLPQKSLVFTYVDIENLLSSLFKNEDFIAQKGYELSALLPLLQIFEAHGMVLIASENNFAMQSYTNLNKENPNEAPFITFERKYKGNLTEYIEEKPIMLFGGRNISNQLERISKLLSSEDDAKEILFDGLVKAQATKYLGENVSLENDIYPLLKGEYAFFAKGEKEDLEYKFIMELPNPEDDKGKIEVLIKKFMDINAVFEPEIVETKLPDGTVSKEIVATEEEIERIDTQYKNTNVTSLKLGEKNWGIHYAFFGNVVVFGTTKRTVLNSIDLYGDPELSFKESYLFDAVAKGIIKNCDEISVLDFDFILDKLNFDKEKYGKYIEPFAMIVSGKNFFDDGIAGTNYIIAK